jgi:K+-sensing histidine kinase KdpD
MIVHDMASPLLAVQIHLKNLKRQATGLDERSQEGLREAASSAEELQRMIDNLLDVSRLEEGKMPVWKAVWDLTRDWPPSSLLVGSALFALGSYYGVSPRVRREDRSVCPNE